MLGVKVMHSVPRKPEFESREGTQMFQEKVYHDSVAFLHRAYKRVVAIL